MVARDGGMRDAYIVPLGPSYGICSCFQQYRVPTFLPIFDDNPGHNAAFPTRAIWVASKKSLINVKFCPMEI